MDLSSVLMGSIALSSKRNDSPFDRDVAFLLAEAEAEAAEARRNRPSLIDHIRGVFEAIAGLPVKEPTTDLSH
jgi:hypothetical protein